MTEILPARFPHDLETVVSIFREYVKSPTANLDFQDYEAEFAALPGKYAEPEGRLLLAWGSGGVLGCTAFRRVDAETCEMKRVYVRPDARGEWAFPAAQGFKRRIPSLALQVLKLWWVVERP